MHPKPKKSLGQNFLIDENIINLIVEVGDVKFTNGLLSVTLTKVIPDHQKRKVYDIT